MSGDARPPPVLHRGFLGFNNLVYKLRKAANKVAFEQDVAAGFQIMIDGKTSRSWMANLLTLIGKDITSSSSPSSSYVTYTGSKSSLAQPSFDSKLIVDCASAAATGMALDMSPAVVERVLADHTPLEFNEALKADVALAHSMLDARGDRRVIQFLLTDPLGTRKQILERYDVMTNAARYFGLPLKSSFLPAPAGLLYLDNDDDDHDVTTQQMERRLGEALSEAIGSCSANFTSSLGAMGTDFNTRLNALGARTDPSTLKDVVSVAVAEALSNNTTLTDLRGRADEHNTDVAELRAGLYELQSQRVVPNTAPPLPSSSSPSSVRFSDVLGGASAKGDAAVPPHAASTDADSGSSKPTSLPVEHLLDLLSKASPGSFDPATMDKLAASLRAAPSDFAPPTAAPSPSKASAPPTSSVPPTLSSSCPRPSWVFVKPVGFNASRCETPRIGLIWHAAPRGEDSASKGQRKAMMLELASDKLLARLPEPTVDASATLIYCEVRHSIIEDMFGYAYILYNETSLLRALQRCATDRQRSANPRFAPLWRRLASATDLVTFIEYMDRLFQDTTGSMTQYSWTKAMDGATDGADLLGRLRHLLVGADNIDRGRELIIQFLGKRKDTNTIAALQRAGRTDIDEWESILVTAAAADRVVHSQAPSSDKSRSSPRPTGDVPGAISALSAALQSGNSQAGANAIRSISALSSWKSREEDEHTSSNGYLSFDTDIDVNQATFLFRMLQEYNRAATVPPQPVQPPSIVIQSGSPPLSVTQSNAGTTSLPSSGTAVQPSGTGIVGAFTPNKNNRRPLSADGAPLVFPLNEIYPKFELGEVPPRAHPNRWIGYVCPFHTELGFTLVTHPNTPDAKPPAGCAFWHNVWYCGKIPTWLQKKATDGVISVDEATRLSERIPAPYWTAAAAPPGQ